MKTGMCYGHVSPRGTPRERPVVALVDAFHTLITIQRYENLNGVVGIIDMYLFDYSV